MTDKITVPTEIAMERLSLLLYELDQLRDEFEETECGERLGRAIDRFSAGLTPDDRADQ